MNPERCTDAKARRRLERGSTLIEMLIATGILVLTSLSLAYAFTSTELTSRMADRAVLVRASLEKVEQSVADVPYDQLLSWNGVTIDWHSKDPAWDPNDPNAPPIFPKGLGIAVTVATNLVTVGLILVDFNVVDVNSGEVLARLATYRSAEG